MPSPKFEEEVEVIKKADKAMLVRPEEDEEKDGWVPYSLIDEESTINEDSDEGDTGVLIIPQWKADELGW